MPPSRLFLLTAATLVLASAVTDAQTAQCTEEQTDAFGKTNLAAPGKCLVQSSFDVCDDDCLKAAEELVAVAANCTSGGLTLAGNAKKSLDKCKKDRATVENKYMPQASSGLPNCTLEEMNAWEFDYGPGTATRDCIKSTCSEDCLKMFEVSVSKAPLCVEEGGYSLGETKKTTLLRCIVQLGQDPRKNTVLQTVVSGSGNSTSARAPVVSSAPSTSEDGSTTSEPPLATTAPPVVTTSSATTIITSLYATATAVLVLALGLY